jgi:integrase/recombinase XerD
MNTADAVQSFLYSRRSLNRRPTTLKWYERNLKRFVAFTAELPTEPEPLEQFLVEVVPDGQEQTRHGYYRTLKALYRFICRRRHLPNPMEFIDPPARHKKIKASLSAKDLMVLLTRPLNARDRALITFLVDSGCRAGEAASLLHTNIYEGHAMVDGKKGQRFVFITDETRRLLLNLVASNNSQDAHVFQGERGALTYSGIYRIVNKHLKAAEVPPPKMGPHRLRHAFGKNYILAGGDTRSLQELMGHEDISVTEEYVELSRAELLAKHHRFTPLRSVQAATQGSLFPDEETRQAVEEAEKIITENS